MARTGTQAKFKVSTLKQQRENAELEAIIEEFGRTMRNANRQYIALSPLEICCYRIPQFTPNMESVWAKYTEFCASHTNE